MQSPYLVKGLSCGSMLFVVFFLFKHTNTASVYVILVLKYRDGTDAPCIGETQIFIISL